MDTSDPADALVALASPSSPAAATEQPAVPLTLTAIPHHVATQRTGAQRPLCLGGCVLEWIDFRFEVDYECALEIEVGNCLYIHA